MRPTWSDWFGRGRSRRPRNVVWICADDFAPYVSGAYGNPLARTPNLDRLAREGIRFDRAYCACPLSTPSRMAFLTGRYPRSVGVQLSPDPLPLEEITIGRLLRQAGYEAIALGKTHFYRRLDSEFDRIVDHCLSLLRSTSEQARADHPGIRLLGPWRPFRDPASVWLNADGLPFAPDAAMSGTMLARDAAAYLRSKPRNPFFLWVGFYEVHSPFRFPIEFAGRFDPAGFPVPAVATADLDRLPTVFRHLTDAEKRGVIAAYYTSVAYMDRNVGTILDALDRSGLADDTLVLFNSDHGYLLGQHGRFEKHCSYEEAVRTALIVRQPGLITPGTTTEALVELIDVVPTILDLCGLKCPPNLHGRSLGPLLRGEIPIHRDHVIAEYADNAEAMVRTERWKLVHSTGLRERHDGYALDTPPERFTRLFDLANDPAELVDVGHLPENQAIVARLLAILVDHVLNVARDADTPPLGETVQAILDRTLSPAEPRS